MLAEGGRAAARSRMLNRLLAWLPAGLLALPVLVLLPGMAMFPYRSAASLYSDYAITHYPNAVFLLRTMRELGQVPLWSPAILSGYPFMANPLSGLLYPPGWFAYLFPLPFGFNLLVAAHLAWGGIGLYRLMLREGLDRRAALLAGAGFALLPKLYAHLGAGHLTLLYAVAWTPWLLLASARDGRMEAGPEWWRRARKGFPGLILGLIFLADVRWSLYAGSLWIAYAIVRRWGGSPRQTGAYLAKQVALAFCIAAPLALPLLEYVRLSSRSALGPEDVGAFSLPPAGLIGLFFPDFQGNHEWVLYAGGVALALAVAGLFLNGKRSGIWFWWGACLAALLLALGAALPGFSVLARLPGLNLLRVPARSLFLAGMSSCAIAGYAVHSLMGFPTEQSRRRIRLALTGLAAVALLLLLGLSWMRGSLPLNLIWGAAFVIAGAAWIWLGLGRLRASRLWMAGLFLLAILDWAGAARLSFAYRPAEQVLKEGREAADFLARQPGGERPGGFRVYSPSYSLPQQTAAPAGLELADGVDPLYLEAYARYMEGATGVPRAGYQVTIPAFAGGDPPADNQAYRPDAAALGRLNVAFIAAEFDLRAEQLVLLKRIGTTRIYQNLAVRPRAWLQPAGLPLGAGWMGVSLLEWTPNRIQLSAPGAGLLVLSEIAYPGWRVRVDGRPARIEPQEELLRAVRLGEGPHRVEFEYVPVSFYAGLAILAAGLSIWAVAILWPKRRS